MELVLTRKTRTTESTIGELTVNSIHECFILEDIDRGLYQEMSLATLQKIKVYAKTAIPSGRYQVILSYSNRFKQYMPLVVNVPGYEGIRIHWGNTAGNSAGCLIVGNTVGKDFVGDSKKAFSNLFMKLQAAEKKEKIFITIK